MKKIIIILVLLILASNVNAIKVNNFDVQIQIDSEGKAEITEYYSLGFSSPFEEREFTQKATEYSSNLSVWQAELEFFFPHFEEIAGNTRTQTAITFDDVTKILTLQYGLNEPLARLISEEQRTDLFIIDSKQWAAFKEAGAIVIPENTSIKITVPINSEIDATKLPSQASINNNEIYLTGIQSNSINIEYKVLKPIAPSGGELFQGLSDIYLILIPILVVALIIGYFKRDEIDSRVESFVVENSEIKRRETEDDFELKLD